MNAQVASLRQLFARSDFITWALNVLHRLMIAATYAITTLWHHATAAFIGSFSAQHAAAAISNPQPVGASVYPVRVIDVEKTVGSRHGNVVFIKPTNWEFHTISHTWSKGVQSWSNIIASKLMVAQSSGAVKVSYDDLFQREDFSWHECYAPFMEFLRLLRADGVRQVWLDALCINQGSESGEKSQELQKMGSFYAKSLGCYVCVHGFGEGYETWKETESKLAMPRWFNRVWTFQEMLLPKTATFILDIHPVVRRTINWCISQQAAQGINGPCKCAMGLHTFPEPRYLVSGKANEDYEEEEEICSDGHDPRKDVKHRGNIEIMCGDMLCSQCGGAPLIRRAKGYPLMQQQSSNDSTAPDVHFIERQCIVRLMIMAGEQLQRTVWKDCDESAEWKLLRLETVLQQRDAEQEETISQGGLGDDNRTLEHGWDPIQVIVEVSQRDCTHDEDRILSILGLLGLEGAVQLRAGKTLDVQLLHLARQLVTQANPTALVKLCIAQYAGHGRPGMSWAPSLGAKGGLQPTGEARPAVAASWRELRQDEQMYARQMEVEGAIESGFQQLGQVMRHFTRSLEVKRVLEDGPLVCQAQVLWGCSFERVDLQHLFDLHITSADYHYSFPFKAYFSPSSCLLHHRVIIAGYNTLANQSMVRLEGTQLDARLRSFQVCLVLLGQLHLPSEEKHEVLMVCVGNKCDGFLHKVGLAWLPGLEKVLSLVDPSSMVTLGGLDDYMDRFVFV